MKTPTYENYITWLVDLKDGHLTPSEEALLHEFLKQNPQIKAESDLFLSSDIDFIKPNDATYQSINPLNANAPKPKVALIPDCITETLMVGYMEGDLSKTEQATIQSALSQNKVLQSELQYFNQTRLSPDPLKVFKNKATLYKPRFFIPYRLFAPIGAVAALCLLITAGLYLRWGTFGSDPKKSSKYHASYVYSSNNQFSITRLDSKNNSDSVGQMLEYATEIESVVGPINNAKAKAKDYRHAAKAVIAHTPLAIKKPQTLEGLKHSNLVITMHVPVPDNLYALSEGHTTESATQSELAVNTEQYSLTRREVRLRNYKFIRHIAGEFIERYAGIQKEETETRVVYKAGFITYNKSKF